MTNVLILLVKYWDNNFNIALVIATVLDPSKKLEYLEFFYEKVCENVDDIDINVESAKDWTNKYFQKYEQLVTRNSEHSVSCASDTGRSFGSPVLGKRKIEEEFAQYRSQRRRWREPRSELDMYLEDEFEKSTDKFNVLSWWKQHAEKYPVLSAMARDFLAIPLSTVSSESAFSCSGRILGDTRSSLTPEMLEALVCGKDWLTKVPISEGIIVIFL